MNCIVTAGPTFEPLDEVRRLTNFSTGRFGSALANFLAERGHHVTLLLGHYATYNEEQKAQAIEKFTTTSDLQNKLQSFSRKSVNAIFHAAAVSDFGFGKVYERGADGRLHELKSGKFSTGSGKLLAELAPTPKIIGQLRGWFPRAGIIGWKYEVDGDRPSVLAKAEQQIAQNQTDGCVANGPAYGFGFGLVTAGRHTHYTDLFELFGALEKLVS